MVGLRSEPHEGIAELWPQTDAALLVELVVARAVELVHDPVDLAPRHAMRFEDLSDDGLAPKVRIHCGRCHDDSVYRPAVLLRIPENPLFDALVGGTNAGFVRAGDADELGDDGVHEADSFHLRIRAGAVKVENREPLSDTFHVSPVVKSVAAKRPNNPNRKTAPQQYGSGFLFSLVLATGRGSPL